MSEKEKDLKKVQTELDGVVMPKSQIVPDLASLSAANQVQESAMINRMAKISGQRGVVMPQNAVPPHLKPSDPPVGKPQVGVVIPPNSVPPPTASPDNSSRLPVNKED